MLEYGDMVTDINTILILLGIGAIIIEVILGAATGFDLFLSGLFFIAGGLVGRYSGQEMYALAVIFMLAIFYIFIGRRIIRDRLSVGQTKSGVDNLIGKSARVVKTIHKVRAGQIKIEGEVWRAASNEDIDEGQKVMIQSVSGVTLQVVHNK